MGERETRKVCLDPDKMLGASDQPFDSEPLFPRAYSPASAVGAPDEQDLLEAEVLELRGRTARAELRAEVLTRALQKVRSQLRSLPRSSTVERLDQLAAKALEGGEKIDRPKDERDALRTALAELVRATTEHIKDGGMRGLGGELYARLADARALLQSSPQSPARATENER